MILIELGIICSVVIILFYLVGLGLILLHFLFGVDEVYGMLCLFVCVIACVVAAVLLLIGSIIQLLTFS